MNRDHIEGQASALTEEAPERVKTLLDVIGGQQDPFFGALREKYGLAEGEALAERRIEEWRKNLRL